MCAERSSSEPQLRELRVPVCYATRSGGTTIDRDAEGGNPFATALIELSSSTEVEIADLPMRLRELTRKISHDHQLPEWIGAEPSVDWRLRPSTVGPKHRRVALVLVVSDYGLLELASLDGAAWDELRISAMLAHNGFSVTQGVGSSRMEILAALEAFSDVSRDSDAAIIYSAGHGREADGQVYLLPGDFSIENGFPAEEMSRRAVSVERLAEACSARAMNLVSFAGCRSSG